jgi:hypothetical protein
LIGGKAVGFVIFGAVTGISCALLRCRLPMLLSLSALLAIVVTLSDVALHAHHPWEIVAHCVGFVVVLQFVYVAVSLTLDLARFRGLVSDAIGRRLRVELEVPRNLTPELPALLGKCSPA